MLKAMNAYSQLPNRACYSAKQNVIVPFCTFELPRRSSHETHSVDFTAVLEEGT